MDCHGQPRSGRAVDHDPIRRQTATRCECRARGPPATRAVAALVGVPRERGRAGRGAAAAHVQPDHDRRTDQDRAVRAALGRLPRAAGAEPGAAAPRAVPAPRAHEPDGLDRSRSAGAAPVWGSHAQRRGPGARGRLQRDAGAAGGRPARGRPGRPGGTGGGTAAGGPRAARRDRADAHGGHPPGRAGRRRRRGLHAAGAPPGGRGGDGRASTRCGGSPASCDPRRSTTSAS